VGADRGLYGIKTNGEASISQSYYLICRKKPSFVVFGPFNGPHFTLKFSS
jgi:hypothetical protein